MSLYRWDIKNNNKVFNYGKNHQHLYNITRIYRARDKEMEKRTINKKTFQAEERKKNSQIGNDRKWTEGVLDRKWIGVKK